MNSGDGSYRIADDPRPTRLSRIVISPMLIFFLGMIFSLTLGCAWLVLNAFAMGHPKARRDCVIAVAGVAGIFGFAALYDAVLPQTGFDPVSLRPYVKLCITALWLLLCYGLFLSQARVFPIFQYFRNAPAVSLRNR